MATEQAAGTGKVHSVTRERLQQGMSYAAYRAQMTRNGDRFDQRAAAYTPSAEHVAALKALPEPLDVLVLGEDWCGDVINNVPILGKLAEASGKLNLHIFLRDQNDDLMDQYLNQGKYKSIPVFAFFDKNMQQRGVFIERPAAVTTERERRRQALYAQNPGWGDASAPVAELPEATQNAIQSAMLTVREELMGLNNDEVAREIVAICTGAGAGR